ncbi:MAG: nucleotidyltransferase domain-containing protein [Elusimicrobiota bacterium]
MKFPAGGFFILESNQARIMPKTPTRGSAKSWLTAAVKRIVAKARPKKIVLFGSRAYGKPDAGSDFDLLVLLDRPDSREGRYDLVDSAVGAHYWPLDLLVRSRSAFAWATRF